MHEPSEEILRQIYLSLQDYLTSKNYKNIKFVIFDDLCSEPALTQTILQCKKNLDTTDLFVLDGAYDDYDVKRYSSIATRFEDEGLPNFIMLSGNCYHHFRKINKILYYPWCWKQTKILGSPQWDVLHEPKKYVFSSLNGRARWHRVLLAKCMMNKPYIDQCAFTFNDRGLPDHHKSIWDQPSSWWVDLEYAGDQRQQLLSFIKENLPYKNFQADGYGSDLTNSNNDAYHNSYINIITETNISQPFFSEKTFKALANGQFFISINASGSLDFLKSFGFDTFDDIIDQSYDKILDPYKKILAVSDLLDDLIKLNWPKIWKSTQTRRQKNVEHFFSTACEQLVTYHLEQQNL